MPNRNPWQMSEAPRFGGSRPVSLHAFSDIRDDSGLAATSITLAPHARTLAPDPSTSNGQYIVVTRGSLVYEGREHAAITVGFVQPHDF